MKYRIRNMKSGKIVAPVQLELSYNYLMGTDGIVYDDEFFPMPNHKAEMEVADGFYEGDYVLAYDEIDNPYVYLITGTHELLSVDNDYSSTLLYPQCLVGNYEVIKCR